MKTAATDMLQRHVLQADILQYTCGAAPVMRPLDFFPSIDKVLSEVELHPVNSCLIVQQHQWALCTHSCLFSHSDAAVLGMQCRTSDAPCSAFLLPNDGATSSNAVSECRNNFYTTLHLHLLLPSMEKKE